MDITLAEMVATLLPHRSSANILEGVLLATLINWNLVQHLRTEKLLRIEGADTLDEVFGVDGLGISEDAFAREALNLGVRVRFVEACLGCADVEGVRVLVPLKPRPLLHHPINVNLSQVRLRWLIDELVGSDVDFWRLVVVLHSVEVCLRVWNEWLGELVGLAGYVGGFGSSREHLPALPQGAVLDHGVEVRTDVRADDSVKLLLLEVLLSGSDVGGEHHGVAGLVERDRHV